MQRENLIYGKTGIKLEPIVRDNNVTYKVIVYEKNIGTIEISQNHFHNRNCYLKMRLEQYESSYAKQLFEELYSYLKSPLQVMISSDEGHIAEFLSNGGFVCKRRCFEMEVTRKNMMTVSDCNASGVIGNSDCPLIQYEKGSLEYEICCDLLFLQYADNHENINPLTVGREEFCASLPVTVLCQLEQDQVVHFAFVEENEIAYVGSTDTKNFSNFARTLLEKMFEYYKTISFESDDCDEAAMILKGLFTENGQESFDTYVFE